MTFLSPMLLETADRVSSDVNYIFEFKADGHRLILSKEKDIKLFTRNNNLITDRYPELHNIPIDGDCILDGELVVHNPDTGLPCFELTMKRFKTTKEDKIRHSAKQLPVVFMVFDIIKYKNCDTTKIPILERN
jgi:DNA ligase-1